ncbi:GMC family oxidoreductase [Desulfuromonas sp.]|uniref:FAD-dependent oxidoreductase n=1 Tax=Desulfuromonas sp. TaxID=892 RepID=UPI0025C26D7C|nr:GMC family oxidoreductase [Desulfuromonas sp.]
MPAVKGGTSCDFLIVGSGAGGGTLARELAKRGRQVLVIERGKARDKVGAFLDGYRFFDLRHYPRVVPRAIRKRPFSPPRSKEGVILWRALMAGGSTVISCGNGVRSMERELAEMGVALEQEFAEAEKEMGLSPIDERLLSPGSLRIREAAGRLDHEMRPMPKFIKTDRCNKCGHCHFGCARQAKWTAVDYLREAEKLGAKVLYEARVTEVRVERGKARGVRCVGPDGPLDIDAKVVILAAGGLETPAILQRSRLKEAGGGFFLDLMWNTYGVTDGLHQDREPVMALVELGNHSRGFLLSPFMNQPRLARSMETGPATALRPSHNMLGIMTKISDEANGRVLPDGSFSKPVTARDRRRLAEGAAISRRILAEAGAAPASLGESRIQGAHPGGTAAIGTVVGTDLQTAADNLFVCDASVLPAEHFPEASRMPPILTIVALAKRLAKTLAGEAGIIAEPVPVPTS